MPEGIAAVIRQKVERLEESDRRLLEAASVEGEAFSAAVAARLVDAEEGGGEDRLRRLAARHRLVEPAGETEYPDGSSAQRFRFAHSLYQHAFYDELTPKRRELWHRRAAEELERLHAPRPAGVLAQLAGHWEKGRDFRRAIEKSLAAADVAAWRNPKDARPFLDKALALAARLPAAEARAYFDVSKTASINFINYWQTLQKDFDHGEEIETSLVLAIRPELVKMKYAKKTDNMLNRSKTAYQSMTNIPGSFQKLTGNGIWGDPMKASIRKGNVLIKEVLKKSIETIGQMNFNENQKSK